MPVKALLGVIPVIWFGGLAIYLYRVNQTIGGWSTQYLMPTILGLTAMALLFGVLLLMKLLQPAKPKESKTPTAADDAAPSDFDADAVIARYLEKKAAGEASFEVPESSAPRPVFGRKI